MTNATAGWDRVPAILSFPDTARFTETYGFSSASGKVWLEGQYLIPRERPSKTLYLFMHPSSTLHLLPTPGALVGAGLHVLCAASRYPKNDSGLIIEKVAIDMGAWVKDARARGYEKVILVAVLSGGSRSAVDHRDAGGRRGRPDASRSRTGRRRNFHCRAPVTRRDIDRVARSIRDRRTRPRPTGVGIRHL
jgi:hypothetical protein